MNKSHAASLVRGMLRSERPHVGKREDLSGAGPVAYFINGDFSSNQVIETINGPLSFSGENILVNDPDPAHFAFFVDDLPQANWEHPCRYVFVHDSGRVSQVQETAPPSSRQNIVLTEMD